MLKLIFPLLILFLLTCCVTQKDIDRAWLISHGELEAQISRYYQLCADKDEGYLYNRVELDSLTKIIKQKIR
jgi:hypothetical protein